MTLTREQLFAIAPRVLPTSPCPCGRGTTTRIEPVVTNGRVTVSCGGCHGVKIFSAAELGLVPSATAN